MDFTIYGNTPYIASRDISCSSTKISVLMFDGVNWVKNNSTNVGRRS